MTNGDNGDDVSSFYRTGTPGEAPSTWTGSWFSREKIKQAIHICFDQRAIEAEGFTLAYERPL